MYFRGVFLNAVFPAILYRINSLDFFGNIAHFDNALGVIDSA
jgi:hypothetical protein